MGSKYCTRVAISPMLWASFAEDVCLPLLSDLNEQVTTASYHVWDLRLTKDAKLLMKCGGYREAEYCSTKRQRKYWKMPETFCSRKQT